MVSKGSLLQSHSTPVTGSSSWPAVRKMRVTTLRVPVFLTGLALIFCILVHQADAAPPRRPLLLNLLKSKRKISTSGIETNTVAKEDQPIVEEMLRRESNEPSNKLTSQILNHTNRILDQTRISTLAAYFFDVAIALMHTTDNILNSRTNITYIDTFMNAFNDLVSSRGLSAVNIYYQIWSNGFVPIDAVAQFVRGFENRFLRRQEVAETLAALAESRVDSGYVKKVSIKDVRNELGSLKKNINTWICSQAANMAEEGVNIKRHFQARNIDCLSLIDLEKENYEDEDDNERPTSHPLTLPR